MIELIRRSVRKSVTKKAKTLIAKKKLTVNGFTPEFEEEVLQAAAEPVGERDFWDGKGSFVKWALLSKRKSYGKG